MTRRKMMRIVLSICLVAVVAVGSTLAYLSTVTNDVTNVFSFSENITAKLEEPNWKPEDGLNLVPGSEVPKDPQIVNTSDIDEYVAIKLTFQNGADPAVALNEADMTRLMGLIEIHYNGAAGFNSDWALVNSADSGKTVQTWYYKKLVKAEATPTADPLSTTAPLFDKVVIKSTITGEDITWLKDTLKGFQIYIEGAAVQASVFEDPSDPTLTEAEKAADAASDPDAGLYYLLNGANVPVTP